MPRHILSKSGSVTPGRKKAPLLWQTGTPFAYSQIPSASWRADSTHSASSANASGRRSTSQHKSACRAQAQPSKLLYTHRLYAAYTQGNQHSRLRLKITVKSLCPGAYDDEKQVYLHTGRTCDKQNAEQTARTLPQPRYPPAMTRHICRKEPKEQHSHTDCIAITVYIIPCSCPKCKIFFAKEQKSTRILRICTAGRNFFPLLTAPYLNFTSAKAGCDLQVSPFVVYFHCI